MLRGKDFLAKLSFPPPPLNTQVDFPERWGFLLGGERNVNRPFQERVSLDRASGQSERKVYSFPRAAMTAHHRLGGFYKV